MGKWEKRIASFVLMLLTSMGAYQTYHTAKQPVLYGGGYSPGGGSASSGSITTALGYTPAPANSIVIHHSDGTWASFAASTWVTTLANLTAKDHVCLGPGTYTNSSTEGPFIGVTCVIEGAGPNATILQNTDGNNAHSVMTVNANNIELRNLQIAVPVTANVDKGVTIGNGAVVVDGLRITNCIIAGSADTMLCSGCATNFYSSHSNYYTWFDGFFASIQGEFDNCTFVAGSSTVDYPNNTTVFRARKNTVSAVAYPTQIVLNRCNLTVQTNSASTNLQLYCFKGAANCTLDAYNTTFTTKNYNASTTQGGNIWGVLIGNASCAVTLHPGCTLNVTSADSADTGTIYDIDNTSAGTANYDPQTTVFTNGSVQITGTITPSLPTTSYTKSTYGSGTAYTLTATPAAIALGTTSPSLTLDKSGRWKIYGKVNVQNNGATFASSRTVTAQLQDTTNSVSITNGSDAFITGAITGVTSEAGDCYAEAEYTVAANAVITIFGSVSVTPTAGSIQCVAPGTWIKAQYLGPQ